MDRGVAVVAVAAGEGPREPVAVAVGEPLVGADEGAPVDGVALEEPAGALRAAVGRGGDAEAADRDYGERERPAGQPPGGENGRALEAGAEPRGERDVKDGREDREGDVAGAQDVEQARVAVDDERGAGGEGRARPVLSRAQQRGEAEVREVTAGAVRQPHRQAQRLVEREDIGAE